MPFFILLDYLTHFTASLEQIQFLTSPQLDEEFLIPHPLLMDPAGLFPDTEYANFFQDIGKMDFKVAGNGMRYTHGTGNALAFLFGKRDVYDTVKPLKTDIP